ncbi:hypothetical protein C1645_876069 [Glomus cerebriforme]|uniref:Uncharacterized protein n=1 Tax=Glomus cerebriforme TaxID=658196 RepID=A0A397T5U8_9GLOM|nr:hypothetical protein C1645_876069 [Glomus cerebriforme]
MDIDLRNYLQQKHNQRIWGERIKIMCDIIDAIDHLGFCGPADKSPKSMYGNLPYVAPVIARK